MTDGPILYTPDGEPVRIHVVTESGDCEYVGLVDEGVLGFDEPDDSHVSVALLEVDRDSLLLDDDRSTSEQLAYGDQL